jgi:hypothetical protein
VPDEKRTEELEQMTYLLFPESLSVSEKRRSEINGWLPVIVRHTVPVDSERRALDDEIREFCALSSIKRASSWLGIV